MSMGKRINMSSGRARKSTYNIGFSVISQSILMVTGFILPQLILSYLGSDVNGFLGSITQVFSYLDLMRAGVGMAAIQALYAPIKKNNRQEQSHLISTSKAYFNRMGIFYFISVVLVGIGFVWWGHLNLAPQQIFLCIFFQGLAGCLSFSCIGFFTDLLRAEGKNYMITLIQTGGTILTQILEIIVLLLTVNVVAMRAMTVLVVLLEMLLFRLYRKKYYPWLQLSLEPDFRKLKNKYSYLTFHITGLICTSTDTVLISFLCGFKLASVYVIYRLIINAVNSLINTIYSSTSFLLGHAYQDGLKEFTRVHDAYFLVYTTITTSLFTVCCVLMKPFISLYTINITDISYIYAGLPIMFCFIQILTSCKNVGDITINVGGYAKNVVWHAILEASINLVLSLLLIPKMGIYGALIGTMASIIYRSIDVLCFSNHKVLQRSAIKNGKVLLLNIGLFVLISLLGSTFGYHVDSYFIFFIMAIIISVLLIILFFAVNLVFNRQERDIILYISKKYLNTIKQRYEIFN